jgi:hypothetical protein
MQTTAMLTVYVGTRKRPLHVVVPDASRGLQEVPNGNSSVGTGLTVSWVSATCGGTASGVNV